MAWEIPPAMFAVETVTLMYRNPQPHAADAKVPARSTMKFWKKTVVAEDATDQAGPVENTSRRELPDSSPLKLNYLIFQLLPLY